MRNTEETRSFVAAIHEEGGTATTSDIRQRTELTEGQIHHQYRKLERHDWITVSKQSVPTVSGSRMKVAELTEKAVDEINNKAFLSHDQQPERTKVDVVELANQVEANTESIEEIQQYVGDIVYERLSENSNRIDKLESSQNKLK